MSKLTDYKGDVMVEVSIGWEVEVKPGSFVEEARAAEPKLELGLSWLCSDRVKAIIINKRGQMPPPGKVPIAQPLAGIDDEERQICDIERAAYILGPINTTDLQALIDEQKVAVELTWSYREVFELILHEWQSTDTKKTLASRKDDDPLLASIIDAKHLGSKKSRVPFKYRELRTRATVAAEIVDYKVTPVTGGPPAVQVVVLLQPDPSIRDALVRALCAAAWSSLSEVKVKAPITRDKIPKGLRCCILGIQRWIAGTLGAGRGRKIVSGIVKVASSASDAKALVTTVRAEIDKYLIAANHWGEARETVSSSDPIERYQARMSDFFGMLYEKYTLASPVNLARGLFKRGGGFGINILDRRDFETVLWLQLGVGHCGEHARVGFAVLKETMKANPGCPVTNIVRSGNANIDHAFVLVNLTVDFVFQTRVLNKHNSLFAIGETIEVFDLKYALAQAGNGDALVHDAYLQFEQFKASAHKLLHSLQHKKNKALNTTFVMFSEAYPVTPTKLSSLDLSDSELRKEYPNI